MQVDDKQRMNHPVWMVYNMQRTACLNAKYYGSKLRRLEKHNRLIDGAIAFVAPTSAVASLPFWGTVSGKLIWAWVPSIASVLIVLKGVLKLGPQIKDLEKRTASYQALLFDLRKISDRILADGKYSSVAQKMYAAAIERHSAVMKLPPIDDDKQLQIKLEAEVNREFPSSNFFIPEE